MFANLIESDSHTREFKRRGSFFLATIVAYALILFAAGIASVYAYDARLEAQTDSLEVLNWIPPLTPAAHPPQETHPQPVRRPVPSNAPVDRNITIAERTNAIARSESRRVDVSISQTKLTRNRGNVRRFCSDILWHFSRIVG